MAAPPGYYYLVVNRKTDQSPVPSVARMVHVGTTPDDPTNPTGGSATPDADTSAATRMNQVGELSRSAPAPIAGPATAVTDTAAYSELSARPASANRPVPSPLGAIGVVGAVTSGVLTGRWRLRRHAAATARGKARSPVKEPTG